MNRVYVNIINFSEFIIPVGVIIGRLKQVIAMFNYYGVVYNLDKLEKYLVDTSNFYTNYTIEEYFLNLLKAIGISEDDDIMTNILICIQGYIEDSIIESLKLPDTVLYELSNYKLQEVEMVSFREELIQYSPDYKIDLKLSSFFYNVIWPKLIVKAIMFYLKQGLEINFDLGIPFDDENIISLIKSYEGLNYINLLEDIIIQLHYFSIFNCVNAQIVLNEDINTYILSLNI